MIQRTTVRLIEEKLFRGKVIVIIGARQVGKTTLMKYLGEIPNLKYLCLNCDEPDVREILNSPNSSQIKS